MNKAQLNLIHLQLTDALIVVDPQNDFLPGGKLAVAASDKIIPIINQYINKFQYHHLPIFMTRDWHPAQHKSFQTQGGPWPEHCISGSRGAEFSADLQLPETVRVISTGTEFDLDGYSGFEYTDLDQQLINLKTTRLFIGGLATDYCVYHTVNNALELNYQVYLLLDAIQAVNVQADDGKNAIKKMRKKGAIPMTLDNLL